MPQRKIILTMPGTSLQVFEAFHNHGVRLRWDTLLAEAYVEGGASHPSLGAISYNRGRGWKGWLAMRTRFINYQSGLTATAVLIEPCGPFQAWSASMRHKDLADGQSQLLYSFSLNLRPRWLGRWIDPLARMLFERETRRRFAAMARYLRGHPLPGAPHSSD